jgi:hypothetical protein
MTHSESPSPVIAIPQRHGELSVWPPPDELSRAAERNMQSAPEGGDQIHFCDVSLKELRNRARELTVKLAEEYTSEYRSIAPSASLGPKLTARKPLIMGGHQPDLFHCGVWLKNFLLSKIAALSGGTAIHFLVDNDLCRKTGIQVPTLDSGNWGLRTVHYDRPRPTAPWENCRLQDLRCWNSFPDRIAALLPPLKDAPMLQRLWEYSRQQAQAGEGLGLLLSRSRHLLERDLGLNTLEVPLSQLVSSNEFAVFSLQLICQLPRLHEIYNRQLRSYRQEHKIRNHAQPLPELGRSGDWLEAPWWCYRADSTEREAVWVRVHSSGIELSNRSDWSWAAPLPTDQSAAIEQWETISAQGILLRPRALLTTMYARLILSDLFIHGTGGARYDQLTDRIISEFFGMSPPPVGQATATLHLPFSGLSTAQTQPVDQMLNQWQQKIRAAKSNPEIAIGAFVSGEPGGLSSDGDADLEPELNGLLREKKRLLSEIPPKGEKWEWHHTINRVNRRLKELTEPHLRRMEQHVQQLQQLQAQQSIFQSREFSFCLFPEETVLDAFTEFRR